MPLWDDYTRVDPSFPCPICQKDTWCLISLDGTSAICPRIESDTMLGSAGYLHRLDAPAAAPRRRAARKPRLTVEECRALQAEWEESYSYHECQLGVGFDGEATTYPMRDTEGNIIGFRRRFPDGRKRSVAGSREGLFYPMPLPEAATVLVCEGPTDTLAAMSLGFVAIGRPNCSPYCEQVEAVLDRMDADTVVIVADNDEPGRKGAASLGAYLVKRFPLVHCIVPTQWKDLAEYVQQGNGAGNIMALVDGGHENAHWRLL